MSVTALFSLVCFVKKNLINKLWPSTFKIADMAFFCTLNHPLVYLFIYLLIHFHRMAEIKVKCQYWDRCFRKDKNHIADFLHPEKKKAKGMHSLPLDSMCLVTCLKNVHVFICHTSRQRYIIVWILNIHCTRWQIYRYMNIIID